MPRFDSIHVGTINKRKEKETRIELTTIDNGKKYINIRDWFTRDNKSFIPMRNGNMIPLPILSDLITLLEQIEANEYSAEKKVTEAEHLSDTLEDR